MGRLQLLKISLCMIVKDEESNIINCLDRALKTVDEAIVVDTGSSDKTKELIGDKYCFDSRVKLVEYIWENDFSKARNESLKYATGDWILVLDADERLFADRIRMEEFLESREDKAYILPIYNITGDNDISITSSMIRLFRNDNPHFERAIHEQLYVNGKSFMADIIDSDICKAYHYGYSKVVFDKKDKQNRNMDIIKSEIDKDPESSFNWYNKGVMEMIEGNYSVATDDFLKAHNLCGNIRFVFHNDLIIRVLQCLMLGKKYEMAIDFIKRVSEDIYMKEIPDIYYYCGIAYANIKEYPKAIEYFKRAADTGEYRKGNSRFGAGSFLPKLEWAKVLIIEGEKEQAIEKFKEAVFDKNNAKYEGIEALKYLLKQENRLEELEQLRDYTESKGEKEKSPVPGVELDEYKRSIKENINSLVEKGRLAESKELIIEYEKIVALDPDIYSIKGVIAMMEEDMDGAEEVLLDGLGIQPLSCDILYNLAYLYEMQEKYEEAYKYYERLLNTGDEEITKEAEEKIEEFKRAGVIVK